MIPVDKQIRTEVLMRKILVAYNCDKALFLLCDLLHYHFVGALCAICQLSGTGRA